MTTTTTDHPTLDDVLAAADTAAVAMAASSPPQRAAWLRAAADALDAARDDLVPVAIRESHLPEARLSGEVGRTSGQLRMFADAVERGGISGLVLDGADPDASPVPRPDLRRMLVPVGPVLVFAASNFPFAFSVGGGDTASALAAGCPVVVKAHPGHPQTSRDTAAVLRDALVGAGAPQGVLGLVEGVDDGVTALRDRRIRAAGFTGSVAGGTALHEIAASRPDPIPFHGELGSINPAVVTPGAAAERGADLAAGFIGSFTLGVGQFCTKPGLLFLPVGHGLDEALAEASGAASGPMLHDGIREAFDSGVERLRKVDGVEVLAEGTAGDDPRPTLLRTDVATFLAESGVLAEECFGPTSVVVEYAETAELLDALAVVEGSLTATLHATDDEVAGLGDVVTSLVACSGRLVWNGWPTGVAVSWAMHHGGPFPSTVGPAHTSVGVTASRRFQRPVCFQDTPQAALPEELRDGNPLGLERRVDGTVTTG